MKLKLKILNVFYLVLSVAALASYMLFSSAFLSASFTYNVDEDLLLEEGIDDTALNDLGIDASDLFSDLDTIVFEVKVDISYSDMILAWTETGHENDYNGSKYDAVGRYLTHRILEPSFNNLSSMLQEDLETIATTAIKTMIRKTIVTSMNTYSLQVANYPNCFAAMADNEANVQGDDLNEIQFNQVIEELYANLNRYSTEDRFFNGYDIEDDHYEGLKEMVKPFFAAIYEVESEEEAENLDYLVTSTSWEVEGYMVTFGLFDNYGNFQGVDEAIGHILQRLVDHKDYEDSATGHPLVDKLFAPLREYIDNDNPEFDSPLTQILIKVIEKSNLNASSTKRADGVSGPLFLLFVRAIRVFGILLILFLLAWVIKFVQCVIGFFRAKPYVRLNPLGIITGILEGALAIISLATMIIYNPANHIDVNSIRQNIPVIGAFLPLGLSFSLEFIYIPGILAIINLLFSIVYGPVKKKFKKEAKDEDLYSNEYNDYE